MENKLSELSKPTACRNKHTGRTFNATENTEPQIYESLYSQEYVSALLAELEFEKQNNSGVAGMVEDYETKLEAKDKRIAELEAKLATPVRLPDIRSDDYHETGWFQHMKYYRDVERSIRAAGFAVGDE
ncbi:TPA: hypothetical protein SML58_000861 [Serratia marcescens]|nr:hypothetical protein [Serratia marcescens]